MSNEDINKVIDTTLADLNNWQSASIVSIETRIVNIQGAANRALKKLESYGSSRGLKDLYAALNDVDIILEEATASVRDGVCLECFFDVVGLIKENSGFAENEGGGE